MHRVSFIFHPNVFLVSVCARRFGYLLYVRRDFRFMNFATFCYLIFYALFFFWKTCFIPTTITHTHDPRPTPTTHDLYPRPTTHDPRPTTHDPRPTTFSYTREPVFKHNSFNCARDRRSPQKMWSWVFNISTS